jgi:hypothetical protein
VCPRKRTKLSICFQIILRRCQPQLTDCGRLTLSPVRVSCLGFLGSLGQNLAGAALFITSSSSPSIGQNFAGATFLITSSSSPSMVSHRIASESMGICASQGRRYFYPCMDCGLLASLYFPIQRVEDVGNNVPSSLFSHSSRLSILCLRGMI